MVEAQEITILQHVYHDLAIEVLRTYFFSHLYWDSLLEVIENVEDDFTLLELLSLWVNWLKQISKHFKESLFEQRYTCYVSEYSRDEFFSILYIVFFIVWQLCLEGKPGRVS